MSLVIKIFGIKEEKKQWRAMTRRAKALPKEYRTVFRAVQKYIFATSGTAKTNFTAVFSGVVELLEEASKNGQKAMEVVGGNVGKFADELMRNEQNFMDEYRAKLSQKINQKLK